MKLLKHLSNFLIFLFLKKIPIKNIKEIKTIFK